MTEPIWFIYTGAICGIIGAATGIAGAIMGYKAYSFSRQLKVLDMRLELQKADATVRATIQDLPLLLDRSSRSRAAIAAATGRHGGGAYQQWNNDLNVDQTTIQEMSRELPSIDAESLDVNHADLVSRLVAIHALELRATRMRDKYLGELAVDDVDRENLRANARHLQRDR